jgi:hypothetical protein
MKQLVMLAVVAVLVVAALNVITIEVPSVNPHEGAVAYAQPKLTADLVDYGSDSSPFGTNVPSTISKAKPTILAQPIKYVAPAPVRKSLWQIAIPTGTTISPCSTCGTASPGIGAGGTCTATTTSSVTVSVKTYAKLVVVEPGGGQTQYQTANVTSTVSKTTSSVSCTNGAVRTDWSFLGSATYDVGTYYFTKGWGTYAFTVEIYRVGDGVPDVKLGSSQLAVDASAAGTG